LAVGGLTLGLLFLVVFPGVGGEWFLMWQSPTWDAQPAAFGMLTAIGLTLIFVSLPDPDLDRPPLPQ